MSFSSDVRSEIVHARNENDCCRRSELCAALLCSGGISFEGFGRPILSLTNADATVVRRYFTFAKQRFGVTGELEVHHTDRFAGRTIYRLTFPEDQARILLDGTGISDPEALFGVRTEPREDLCAKECCAISFLRAAFLFTGSVSEPERGWHLEWALDHEALAEYVKKQAEKFEVHAKIACRKTKYVVYLKSTEGIADALTLLGAHAGRLKLENILIAKELRNRINRQQNCDFANINRAVRTAQRQIGEIRYLEEQIGLEKLPKSLQQMAAARIAYEDLSLEALGELMDPPLGKSGVNARLRRISHLAEMLRSGEDISGELNGSKGS